MRLLSRWLLVTAMVPAVAFAQTARHKPTFGLYGGWDRTSLHGPDVPGSLHTSGALGGVYGQWRFGSRFAFQPEVQFVQKGTRELESLSQGGQFATKIRLNYVEIPLLIRASGSTMAGHFTPYLLAGPEIAFKAGCNLKVFGLAGSYTCDDLPKAESYDYGVIGGGGVDVALGRQKFTVSARYDHGLYDVFEGNDPQNRAVTVLVGWALP
jgi:outer membrane protein with beta-barrel domain